jgi:hypothetical protein
MNTSTQRPEQAPAWRVDTERMTRKAQGVIQIGEGCTVVYKAGMKVSSVKRRVIRFKLWILSIVLSFGPEHWTVGLTLFNQ